MRGVFPAAGTDVPERAGMGKRHRRSGSCAPLDESAAVLTPDVSSSEGVERPGELPADLPQAGPRRAPPPCSPSSWQAACPRAPVPAMRPSRRAGVP